MEERVVIAGFGGQGVQAMGQLLTYAGMIEDHFVSMLPSYGPEMRGGTTNCGVILSDEPVASPLVTEATAAMVLNLPSMEKFEPMVVNGGVMLVNASLIERRAQREDIKALYVPCNQVAMELGNARVAGMVMLGAYAAYSGAVSLDSLMESIKKVLGEKKAHLFEINRKALEHGAQMAQK